MKLFYWNACGIANDDTKRALKNFVYTHRPLLVCISEPFVLFSSIPTSFLWSMGMALVTINDKGS